MGNDINSVSKSIFTVSGACVNVHIGQKGIDEIVQRRIGCFLTVVGSKIKVI